MLEILSAGLALWIAYTVGHLRGFSKGRVLGNFETLDAVLAGRERPTTNATQWELP